MTRRIAGMPVWGPSDVIDGMRSLLGWTDEAVGVVAALPERVSALLDDVEALVVRITAVADRVDGVLGRVEGVVGQAADVTGEAGAVVAQAGATSDAARDLLVTYAPIAEQAAPLARRFVTELSETEVQAAIRLVDQLPALTEHMETDIMPILATLDRVGPDVHELLDVLKDVRQAINGIPGFAFFRRRGEREEEEEVEG